MAVFGQVSHTILFPITQDGDLHPHPRPGSGSPGASRVWSCVSTSVHMRGWSWGLSGVLGVGRGRRRWDLWTLAGGQTTLVGHGALGENPLRRLYLLKQLSAHS